MTPEPLPRAGDVLADRYRLHEQIGRDDRSVRFRAHDERLQRDVLVEVAPDPGPGGTPADRVRALTGADDTGLH